MSYSKIISPFIICIFLLLINEAGYTQVLDWDTSFRSYGALQRINAGATYGNHYYFYGTDNHIKNNATLRKLDKNGNLIWTKYLHPQVFDSIDNRAYDMVKVPCEPAFIVSGAFYLNPDFVYKIDTGGNIIWSLNFNPNYSHWTNSEMIILKDKSIVTGGLVTSSIAGGSFDTDIHVRRIDSLGSLMWEMTYPFPGAQSFEDVVAMLDGSICVIGSYSPNDFLLMRLDYQGNLLDTTIFPINDGEIRPSNAVGYFNWAHASINQENELLCAMTTRNTAQSGYDLAGYFLRVDTSLTVQSSIKVDSGIASAPYVLADSSIILNVYGNNHMMHLSKYDPSLMLKYWRYDYGPVINYAGNSNKNIKVAYHNFGDGESIVLSGGSNYLNTYTDPWVAKIDSVGEGWNIHECGIEPPNSILPRLGITYNYNYPVLILIDTSHSGLKYIDTIYDRRWSTSTGVTGISDTFEVIFDTTSNKSLSVSLKVSNWFGSTDSATYNLDFTTTGVKDRQELSFKVYPNPSNGLLHIESNSTNDEGVLRIIDLNGSTQLDQKITNSTNTFDLSGLSNGVYIYEILMGDKVYRDKLIIQK